MQQQQVGFCKKQLVTIEMMIVFLSMCSVQFDMRVCIIYLPCTGLRF